VHEAAVHVGIEEVGHGQHRAVAEGSQAPGHPPLPPTYRLAFVFHLTAVIQQVHEESEVPGQYERAGTSKNSGPFMLFVSFSSMENVTIISLNVNDEYQAAALSAGSHSTTDDVTR